MVSFWLAGDGMALRVFGYGFSCRLDWPVRFSERNGYERVYRVGRWAFRWLKP